jgi:hypothetical protein
MGQGPLQLLHDPEVVTDLARPFPRLASHSRYHPSMSVPGAVAAVVTAALAALVFVIVRSIVLWARLRARTRVAAATIPASVHREVLDLVDRAGEEDGATLLLLRPDPDGPRDGGSHLGGDPCLAPGASWPADDAGAPARFLAQVRLESPPLPPPWAGRPVLVFEGADGDVFARPGATGATPTQAPESAPGAAEVPIRTLRLPRVQAVDDDEDDASFAPVPLVRRVPAIRPLLEGYGAAAEHLLSYVLIPGINTHEVDTFHVCLMGGAPQLIQGEHEARCQACAAPMRFLFQLGDVLGIPGDAPIVYVYGCDAHPERVQAFVDNH